MKKILLGNKDNKEDKEMGKEEDKLEEMKKKGKKITGERVYEEDYQ